MTQLITQQPNALNDSRSFDAAYRAAEMFAKSQLIPAHMRNKVEDCFVALHMAARMGEDPLMIMQNIYVVSGTPGWKTQYMIARANASGVFSGGIDWDVTGEGENLSVVAKAYLAKTGELIKSPAVDFKMAKAEGWTKNTKYNSMPEMMFRYRSAAFLIRLYAPHVMLGYQTVEEVETLPKTINITPVEAPQIEQPKEIPQKKIGQEDVAALFVSIEETERLEDLTALKLASKSLLAAIKKQQPDIFPEIVSAFQERAEAIRNPETTEIKELVQ